MCDTNTKELEMSFDDIWRSSSAKTTDAEPTVLNLISRI